MHARDHISRSAHPLRRPWPRVSLRRAAERVPPGRWGVAASGGADSTALLHLLCRRARRAGDLELVVVHLDHELRGEPSRQDAAFVEALARDLALDSHIRRRSELEVAELPPGPTGRETGVSARLRRLRLRVFAEAQRRHELQGVVLAHHADDVVETLLLRLLRGSAPSGTLGLAPLRFDQTVAGVRLLRPLLGVRRNRLRRFLTRTQRPWREDASNAQDITLRNRLRRLLADRPAIPGRLLDLAAAAHGAEDLLDAVTPALPESPRLVDISILPPPIQRRAARRWMVQQGVPESAAGPRAVESLLALIDAAGPGGVDLPGNVHVRRRRGRLVVDAR